MAESLSSSVIAGLRALLSLTDDEFAGVVEEAVSAAATGRDDGVDGGVAQLLCGVLVHCATCHDTCQRLTHVLSTDVALQEQRISLIVEKFRPHAADCTSGVKAACDRQSDEHARVVDVKWRMCEDRGKQDDVFVSLRTDQSTAGDSQAQSVDFVCDRQQLEHLVSTLRQAVSSLHKMAATNSGGQS